MHNTVQTYLDSLYCFELNFYAFFTSFRNAALISTDDVTSLKTNQNMLEQVDKKTSPPAKTVYE